MATRSRFFPAIFPITAVVPAAGDPVTIISATRFVPATATGVCCALTNIHQIDIDSTALTAVRAVEPNPSAVGSATQTSRIIDADRRFYRRGSVSREVKAAGGEVPAQSACRLTLDLGQPQNFIFIGAFDSTRLNEGNRTAWSASLTDDSAPDTPILALRERGSIRGYQPGTLQPGHYSFLISVRDQYPAWPRNTDPRV